MRAGGTRRGFTLLELLVVLAIMAAIAGTLVVGVARTAPEHKLVRALEEITTELTIARVEAMQRGHAEAVEVWVNDEGVALARGDRSQAWKTPAIVLFEPPGVTTSFNRVEDHRGPHGGLQAEFDTMGRTRSRHWQVWIDKAPDRIWAIEFEPISGAPHLRKPGNVPGVER